MFINR